MTPPRILVAGIGNIFFGDDAFGVEVAQRLLRRPQPPQVRVTDFGIRGLDLMYALVDGYDVAMLIDAVPRGHAPGTLYVIEPQVNNSPEGEPVTMLDGHCMDPVKVLHAAATMGSLPGRVLLVGCEPTPINADDDMQMELSAPVSMAVDEAVVMIETLVRRILAGDDLAFPIDRPPIPLETSS